MYTIVGREELYIIPHNGGTLNVVLTVHTGLSLLLSYSLAGGCNKAASVTSYIK